MATRSITWVTISDPPASYDDPYQGPVQLVDGELLAYRGWGIAGDEDHPRLRSLIWDVVWPGPTLVANCIPEPKTKPQPQICPPWLVPPYLPQTGGIYACKELTELRDLWRRSTIHSAFSLHHNPMMVWGTVALTGTVVVGTKGYRAERATIRSLQLLSSDDLGRSASDEHLINEFSRVYQVEVTMDRTLRA